MSAAEYIVGACAWGMETGMHSTFPRGHGPFTPPNAFSAAHRAFASLNSPSEPWIHSHRYGTFGPPLVRLTPRQRRSCVDVRRSQLLQPSPCAGPTFTYPQRCHVHSCPWPVDATSGKPRHFANLADLPDCIVPLQSPHRPVEGPCRSITRRSTFATVNASGYWPHAST